MPMKNPRLPDKSRLVRVVLPSACIARLNDEVAPVSIQERSVQNVILSIFIVDLVPVSHEPVFVVAYEEVGVPPIKELTGNALSGPEAGTDQLNQLTLVVLAAEDVLVGPCLPVHHCFPPWGAADQLGNLQVLHDYSPSFGGGISTSFIAGIAFLAILRIPST